MDFEQLIANQHDIFNQLSDDEKFSDDRNNKTNNNSSGNNNQHNYCISGINDTNNNCRSINDKNGKNNDNNGDEYDDDKNNIADCRSNYNKNKSNNKNNQIISNHALNNSVIDCNNRSFKTQFDDNNCPSMSNQPSVNRYCNTEEALTPNLEDIFNETVNDDENFHFDFDNHVLPPCFDSLIINAEDQLLNSPHLDILKLESPQPFDGLSTQESPQDCASSTSEENVENEENETLRSNEQSHDNSNCFDHSKYLDVAESNGTPQSTLPEGLTDCERMEATDKAMSETEIQLIREVNKTLDWDCILPVKTEDKEEHGNQQGVNDHALEPLQEVPCLEDYYKDSFAMNQNTDDIDPKRDICFDDDVFNDLPLDFDDVQTLDIYGSDMTKKPNQTPPLSSPSFPASSPSFIQPEEQEEKKKIENYSGENSPRDTIRSSSDRQSQSSSVSPGAYKVESQSRRGKSTAARHRRQGFHSSLRLHAHKQVTPRKYVRNTPHMYNRNIVASNHQAACAAALGYNRAYAANFHHHHHLNNSLPHLYNNMMANNYGEYPVNMCDKRVFRRVEPRGMGEVNYLQGYSTGIYNEAVEAQLHHDVWTRGEDFAFSRDALDVYLPNEQDVIRRYIVGDKRHVPVPPFTGEIQQLIKRERKKHKNRVAASKCRKKKLEREAQLEVRVNCLKDRSAHLTTVARELRNQATGLKQKIVDHINAGCTLNPSVLPMGINQYYM